MKSYILKFNFFIPILRLGFLTLLVWCIIILLKIIEDKSIDSFGAIIYFFFIFSIIIVSFYQMLKGLLTETLWVKVTPEQIEIKNLILFKKSIIKKQELTGIYNSTKQFAKGSWDSIIIDSNNGKRFELMQFNYFAFKSIFQELDKMGFRHTGTIIRLPTFFGKAKEFIVEQ